MSVVFSCKKNVRKKLKQSILKGGKPYLNGNIVYIKELWKCDSEFDYDVYKIIIIVCWKNKAYHVTTGKILFTYFRMISNG